ncbi:hypothetical protein H3C66_02700 [Patescibacteria group bacterium]|nr:hypothetical protein [Patescibacteria group bacterium]
MFTKRFTLIVVLLLAIFGFTAVANAQDNPPTTPSVGQVWLYNGTQQLMVRSATVVNNSNIVARLSPSSEVTVLEVKNSGGDIWIRHNAAGSDGWSAFRYEGATFFSFVSAPETTGALDGDSSVYFYDSAARVARLVELNDANTGMEALMRASGMTFTAVQKDARQPEEETLINASGDSVLLITGWQVTATNLRVTFPACFTTDLPVAGESISYQPDRNNPSKLYTNNVTPFTGTATVYLDCSNWGQIGQQVLDASAPAVEPTRTPGAVSTPVPGAQGCLTITQLDELGTIINVLEHPVGTPAGAQITLSVAYTAPTGWVMQKNGQEVTNAAVGETVSLWSPDNCRPLGQ